METSPLWPSARTYGASLAAFAEYSGLRAPELPADPIAQTQVRLHRWAVQQFPGDTEELMALGIAEELGELADASGPRLGVDACADVLIYATQLCTANRLDFGVFLRAATVSADYGSQWMQMLQRDAASSLGEIARAIVKGRYRTRGYDDVDKRRRAIAGGVLGLCGAMRGVLERLGSDDVEAYRGVAEGVMLRNWIRDPLRGGAA